MLVHREKRSNAVFYELTLDGTNLLRACERLVFPGSLFRLDRCQVAFAVVDGGVLPEDFRRVEMRNWTAWLGLECGVCVRRTTRSWIVHVEVLRGRSPGDLFGLALNVANRVAVALCKKYGCVLGEGKILDGWEIAVEDPVANLFGRYFTVSTPKSKIDHSWNVGELEHFQKDAVIEYLQMPERVKKMEGQIQALNEGIEKLTTVLGKLIDGEGKPAVDHDQKGLDSYVS